MKPISYTVLQCVCFNCKIQINNHEKLFVPLSFLLLLQPFPVIFTFISQEHMPRRLAMIVFTISWKCGDGSQWDIMLCFSDDIFK